MSLAFLTLSREGLATARRLARACPGAALHAHRAVPAGDAEPFERLADRVAELWGAVRGLVLFAPTGVVVRAVAPLLASKLTDPAVVACDVHGRWAVSLLSGHEGGANALALRVANALDGEAVVSTTTEAVRDLVVGVGCRRGADASDLEAAVREALEELGAPLSRVRLLASVDLKAGEPGLLEAAARLGLPLRLVSAARLRACPFALSPSPAATRRLRLPGVAEPAALLAASRAELALPRVVRHGCTVAVAREATFLEDA